MHANTAVSIAAAANGGAAVHIRSAPNLTQPQEDLDVGS